MNNTISKMVRALFLAVVIGLPVLVQGQSEPELRPGYPERYTVQKGDTLWGIASRFLTNPWRWPAIWKVNESIENPHLIYPGDVLVMVREGGEPRLKLLRKVSKLEPSIRTEPLDDAIPTIPPEAIRPFLTEALVVGEDQLESSPYITEGVEKNILLGNGSQFYARRIEDEAVDFYQVYRPGDAFIHPDTSENLGYETTYLGSAEMLRWEPDVSKMEVVDARQEINPRDRLVEADDSIVVPTFFPRAPDHDVRGRVIRLENGVQEAGPLAVVVITLGERENVGPGDVLRIKRYGGTAVDPTNNDTYNLPEESSGLMMVFKTFEKVSYALILTANRSINLNDSVVTP